MGYKTIEQEVTLKANNSVEMNFTLEENTRLMNDVVVSANRYEVNRKEAATIVNVLTPKVFTTTNSVNLAEGLNYQPGLRVENTCQNCGVNAVRINGLEGSEYIEQFYRAQRCAKHEHSLRLFQTIFLYVYFIEFARNFKINFTYTNVRILNISACLDKLNIYK